MRWHSEARKIADLKLAEHNPTSIPIETICKQCKKSFIDYASNKRLFCGKDCYSLWQKKNLHHGFVVLECEYCKNTFEVAKSVHLKNINASPKKTQKLNFCSCDCSQAYFSQNIYKWRNDSRGENNPAWRGGVSGEKARLIATKRYKDFVKAVLKRDNHQCRVCTSKDRPEVHHIIPFYQNRTLFFVITNGITLCYEHHQQTKRKEEIYINIFKGVLKSTTCGGRAVNSLVKEET